MGKTSLGCYLDKSLSKTMRLFVVVQDDGIIVTM
jgi:hypothetical protein